MGYYQRKVVELWVVIAVFFVALWVVRDDPVFSRAIFVPLVIYLLLNRRPLNYFGKIGLSVRETIEHSRKIQVWCVVTMAFQIVIAFTFVLIGVDLGVYLPGALSLFFAIMFPFLPALIISQVMLYRRLGR